MARGRMISRTLGYSRRFAAVPKTAGALGDFAQLLFVLLIANADDFGRQAGDAWTVKHGVFPSSGRSEDEFEAALDAIAEAGLIQRYQAGGETIIQIAKFDEHQAGLHKRTASKFNGPGGEAGTALDASEKDIEDFLAAELKSGALRLDPLPAPESIERQARRGNNYIDILASSGGTLLVIEVKRQQVSKAAVRQVRGYAAMFPESKVIPIVIGHGVSPEAIPLEQDVVIAEYGDDLQVRSVVSVGGITLSHVKSREPALHLKRTEGKRTEEKRREQNGTQPAGPMPESAGTAWDDWREEWNAKVKDDQLPLTPRATDTDRLSELARRFPDDALRRRLIHAYFTSANRDILKKPYSLGMFLYWAPKLAEQLTAADEQSAATKEWLAS